MSDWAKYVKEGFPVIWTSSPGSIDKYIATVAKVDAESVDVLVWSSSGGNSISADPRHGCRHKDDALWQDAERAASVVQENDSGCFEECPSMVMLVDTAERVERLEAKVERLSTPSPSVTVAEEKKFTLPEITKGKKGKAVETPSPAAFRTGAEPELTDEQKKARDEVLASAGV
jgi:hypothetical protein